MAPSPRFWDRIAKRYAAKPVGDQAAYEKKLDVTRAHFTPESEVLEIGCGTGTTALFHAPYVKHYLATDLSRGMLDIAEEKRRASGFQNLEFQQVSVEDLDLPPASRDAVLAMSILHLLEDREAALAKIYDVLKPGGRLFSSTVCLGESMKWFKLVGPIGKTLGLIPLVKVFTAPELERSILTAGFEIEEQWQHAKGRAVFIVARKPG